MTDARRWALRTALLALGLWLAVATGGGAADSKEPLLPDSEYPKLVEQQVKVLQDALKSLKEAKDKIEAKRMIEKSRCVAVMIAAIAQDNLAGKDGPQRATLRDAALKIASLVKGNKTDEAMQQAADLASVKADAKAKVEKIKLFDAHIDLEETMSQFKLPKAGGQGIEAMLLKLGADKKKMIPATSMNDSLVLMSYQIAVLAELSSHYLPAKDVKDWQTFNADMKRESLDLAEKVKTKDGKAAFTTLNKLNTSCSVCHDRFKKKS